MSSILTRPARRGAGRAPPGRSASRRVPAAGAGALLVDIRPEVAPPGRGRDPGAVVIERNVLEWRLDPDGEHRIHELAAIGTGR